MTQDKAEECSPYLKQAFPSDSMTQVARNKWLDLCMHVPKMKTVYGFNQVRSGVYDDVFSYILLNAFMLVPPMLGDEMGVEVAEERWREV